MAKVGNPNANVDKFNKADRNFIPLRLTIVTPDGARYQTEVDPNTLVAELLASFLTGWQATAPQASVHYSLRLDGVNKDLEPTQSLTEAGLSGGEVLHLVSEALSPSSAVGLVIEGPDGSRYTTALRLDTTVSALAKAFMESLDRPPQARVELLTAVPVDSEANSDADWNSDLTEQYRLLQPDSTLYDERVRDGAQIRIVPAA